MDFPKLGRSGEPPRPRRFPVGIEHPIRGRIRTEATVHDTAVIERGAQIGGQVTIGPYAVIGAGVRIGDGCTVAAHAILGPGTVLGRSTEVHSFAVVGGDPQDLQFDSATRSGVWVGDGVTIREGVTINRATSRHEYTVIHSGVYLMANSHVGHDCQVHGDVVVANNVMLGGHVDVGAYAFLGGGCGIQQFVRIGGGAMVGGNASVSYDVPPHTVAVDRNRLVGLNFVGLRRRAFPGEAVADLKRCFRAVFSGPGDVRLKASAAMVDGDCGATAPGSDFLKFCSGGKRGFVGPRRRPEREVGVDAWQAGPEQDQWESQVIP